MDRPPASTEILTTYNDIEMPQPSASTEIPTTYNETEMPQPSASTEIPTTYNETEVPPTTLEIGETLTESASDIIAQMINMSGIMVEEPNYDAHMVDNTVYIF